jgi:hypothetical protein
VPAKDETPAQRMGRLNRSRGNAIERWVCRQLGIKRVGMFGGKADGGDRDDWMSVQVKSGTAFPTRIWDLLQSIPERGGQLRAVVHVTARGSGQSRDSLISMKLEDFIEWFGPSHLPSQSDQAEETSSTTGTKG